MSLLIVKVIFNKAAILVACRGTKPLAFHISERGTPRLLLQPFLCNSKIILGRARSIALRTISSL